VVALDEDLHGLFSSRLRGTVPICGQRAQRQKQSPPCILQSSSHLGLESTFPCLLSEKQNKEEVVRSTEMQNSKTLYLLLRKSPGKGVN
jgi:hypothetical protein